MYAYVCVHHVRARAHTHTHSLCISEMKEVMQIMEQKNEVILL